MPSVPAGTRLMLHTSTGLIGMRCLRPTDLVGAWAIPVMASAAALVEGHGLVELTTTDGVVRVHAQLVQGPDSLLLCAGDGGGRAVLQQRRNDVRAAVELPLRGVFLEPGLVPAELDAEFSASTDNLSGGGLAAVLREDFPGVPPGDRVFLEMTLQAGRVVPLVLRVVDRQGRRLRGTFLDIAAADREALVRLVFEQQRRLLAGRRLTR
jgi:PilZ domain